MTITILIVWGIWDFITCYRTAHLTALYGKEYAIASINGGIAIFNIILNIGLVIMLWSSGEWWYPIVIHFLFISPIARAINNV